MNRYIIYVVFIFCFLITVIFVYWYWFKYLIEMFDDIIYMNNKMLKNYNSVLCSINYEYDEKNKYKINNIEYKIPIKKIYWFKILDTEYKLWENIIDCDLLKEDTYYDTYKTCKKNIIKWNNDYNLKNNAVNMYYYGLYKENDR